MSEPVGWIGYQDDRLVSFLQNLQQVNQFLDATNPTGQVIPLYTKPQKYCPSENNEAYEKGFIDGMAKQRDSAVQRFVEGGTPDSELAEHKRIIRKQQAEIEKLKKIVIDTIGQAFYEDDYHKAQAEIEALKEARCVACGWNPNLIGGKK